MLHILPGCLCEFDQSASFIFIFSPVFFRLSDVCHEQWLQQSGVIWLLVFCHYIIFMVDLAFNMKSRIPCAAPPPPNLLPCLHMSFAANWVKWQESFKPPSSSPHSPSHLFHSLVLQQPPPPLLPLHSPFVPPPPPLSPPLSPSCYPLLICVLL